MTKATKQRSFWHRPMVVDLHDGMKWHFYVNFRTVCGRWSVLGFTPPENARFRMPSRATAKVCEICERDRP